MTVETKEPPVQLTHEEYIADAVAAKEFIGTIDPDSDGKKKIKHVEGVKGMNAHLTHVSVD